MPDDVAVRLPVRGRAVTVVGASDRSLSIVGALMTAGAAVTVIAPRPAAYLQDLADRTLITLRQRDFRASDLDASDLLWASSGDPETDRAIEIGRAHV